MSQQNLLELAKQGNLDAIAALINRQLNPKGINAKVSRKYSCLRILLESNEVPNQNSLTRYVCSGILKLGIAEIRTLQIFGQQIGDQVPAWSHTIDLKAQPLLQLNSHQEILESQDKRPDTIQDSISSPLPNRPLATPDNSPSSRIGNDSANPALPQLRELAKKRDLQAISSFISEAIALQNVTVEAEMQYGTVLWLKLYSLAKIQRLSCINDVIGVLNDIQPDKVRSVRISEIAPDKKTQVWNKFLALKNGKYVDNTASIKIGIGIIFILIVSLVSYCSLSQQVNTTSSSLHNAPSNNVVENSTWDGSVSQVKSWLKNNLKDPNSVEFIEWSPVQKTEDGGFMVRVKYRTRNSFGGYVIENKVFVLNSAGTVTNYMDY